MVHRYLPLEVSRADRNSSQFRPYHLRGVALGELESVWKTGVSEGVHDSLASQLHTALIAFCQYQLD